MICQPNTIMTYTGVMMSLITYDRITGTLMTIMTNTMNATRAIRSGRSRSSRQIEASVRPALRVRDDTALLNAIPEFSRFIVNRFAA